MGVCSEPSVDGQCQRLWRFPAGSPPSELDDPARSPRNQPGVRVSGPEPSDFQYPSYRNYRSFKGPIGIDKENQPFPVEKVNSAPSEPKKHDTSAFHSQRQPKLMHPSQMRRHLTRLIPKLTRLNSLRSGPDCRLYHGTHNTPASATESLVIESWTCCGEGGAGYHRSGSCLYILYCSRVGSGWSYPV